VDGIPLVPPALLAGANRILFVTHLAIGDFTYLQAGLRAFARSHPHVRIHLWVDERRRTADPAAWPHLRRYALYDWLAACPWIDKVYDSTYSPEAFERSVAEARAEDYPVVVSLAVVDCHRYARLARRVSPRGFVAGIAKPAERVLHMPSRWAGYRKLDARLPMYTPGDCARQHISDIYAGWFARCFGVDVPPSARLPRLDIPARWARAADAQFAQWDVAAGRPVVFVNAYSKSPDRTWPLEHVGALARALRTRPAWREACVVVNVVPEALDEARRMFERRADPLLAHVRLFSADEHFFQLPAVMRLCSLVISVETAVMHLANAVGVPVIALMRRNHPEWAPIDRERSTVLMVPGMDDWVTRIGVEDVLAVLDAQHPDAVDPPAIP
jgi:ADP-heptose:LPS heptosyltransferase